MCSRHPSLTVVTVIARRVSLSRSYQNDRRMKISMMLTSNLMVFVILAVWFLPFGYSLKCYSYLCSNTSAGPSPSCAPPREHTCSPTYEIPLDPDRCITHRFLLETSVPGGGSVTTLQEMRNCSYSFQCQIMQEMTCNAVNSSVGGSLKKCEVGCCEGDLCNSGGPIPTQAPGPTGPSGADLSCLACATPASEMVQNNCSNPVTQSCGESPIPFLTQDRCITVKGKGKFPGFNQSMEVQMKNCSNALMCSQTIICTAMNASANGAMESCQVSCCFGNHCNADSAMTATATGTDYILTSLTCLSAFIVYFYLILIV